MRVDAEALRPTSPPRTGLPGGSNAQAIAERLGLPAEIIADARAAVDPDQAQVESLLTDIRREREEAAAAREAEVVARGEAEQAQRAAEEKLEDVEDRLDEMVERTTAELETDAKTVRDLLAQAADAAESGRTTRAAERPAAALEEQQQGAAKPPRRMFTQCSKSRHRLLAASSLPPRHRRPAVEPAVASHNPTQFARGWVNKCSRDFPGVYPARPGNIDRNVHRWQFRR